MARLVNVARRCNSKEPTRGPKDTAHEATSTTSSSLVDYRQDFDVLYTNPATTKEQEQEALDLVAESVLEQRLTAARAILFHSSTWVLMVLVFILSYFAFYKDPSDYPKIYFSCFAILGLELLLIQGLAQAYMIRAEHIRSVNWLHESVLPRKLRKSKRDSSNYRQNEVTLDQGGLDMVIVTTLAETVIATVILRTVNTTERHTIHRTRQNLEKQNVIIRAWTVKKQYRGLGLGAAILKNAAMICLQDQVADFSVSDSHANSLRILPERFGFESHREFDWVKQHVDRRVSLLQGQYPEGMPRGTIWDPLNN